MIKKIAVLAQIGIIFSGLTYTYLTKDLYGLAFWQNIIFLLGIIWITYIVEKSKK